MSAGIGAADDESAGLLRRVSAALGHDLVVDPGVRQLRQAMARAVSLDVGQLAAPGSSSPVVAAESATAAEARAGQMLSAQLARFSLRARGALPPRHLGAADPALSALGHILDSPAQGRLLIGTPSGLDLADLDQGTVARPPVDGISQTVDRIIPRAGWVAVTTLFQEGIEQLYAVPASLHGAARPLVPVVNGPAVFAGARPDTVWVQRLDGPVEEVDGTGRVVTGPFTLPENGALEGVVDSGLVVAMGVAPDPLTLAVWDPSSRQVTRVIVQGAAFVSAAAKDTVAWVTLGDSLAPDQPVHRRDHGGQRPGRRQRWARGAVARWSVLRHRLHRCPARGTVAGGG